MDPRTAEYAIAKIEEYALAATESRVDDIAALFAEDAELRDPYDGTPQHGREAIRAFFAEGVKSIDSLAVRGPVSITGDGAAAAAPMTAHVDLGGTKLEMDTVDVFLFDESGLLSAMHAFYGPTNVRPKE